MKQGKNVLSLTVSELRQKNVTDKPEKLPKLPLLGNESEH